MATRFEKLIGHQLIAQINIGNASTYAASCQMRGLKAGDLEPIIVPKADKGKMKISKDPTYVTAPDVYDIKGMLLSERTTINLAVKTKLDEFLGRYTETTEINNGLAYFNVEKPKLVDDKEEVKWHDISVENIIVLVEDLPTMNSNGDLLSLYKERVELEVQPEHLPSDEFRMNVYQDLLNAMAFELQGICSARGTPIYDTVDKIKGITWERLRTSNLFWDEWMWSSPENDAMRKVRNYVADNIDSCTTMSDLKLLGEYINSHVEQLPLVRRWWNYGV